MLHTKTHGLSEQSLHGKLRSIAKHHKLTRCAKSPINVEVVKGHSDELGKYLGLVCKDSLSPTGATVVVLDDNDRPCFLPFGKRSDGRAWAVPARKVSRVRSRHKYRCAICGDSLPTSAALDAHYGKHAMAPAWSDDRW